jgi:putative lipoprotein
VPVIAVVLAGCANDGAPRPPQEGAAMKTVEGTLIKLDRRALPPTARAVVRLEDVSLMDAPAKIIAEQTIEPAGQVPIPFSLAYDPAQIDEVMTYAVRGQIFDEGRLVYTSTTHYPVLTRGAPDRVEIRLEPVPATR